MAYLDYYKILKVSAKATPAEIKQAYHELAKKYHPDTNKGSAKKEEKLKQINEAYATLKDVGKRAEYDYLQRIEHQKMQKKPQPTATQPPRTPVTVAGIFRPIFKALHFGVCMVILAGCLWLLAGNFFKQPTLKGEPSQVANIWRWELPVAAYRQKWQENIASFKQKIAPQLDKTLFWAAEHDYVWLLQELLQWRDFSKPLKEVTDEKGYSLLMAARSPAAAALILPTGADINFRAADGQTPLSVAIKADNMALARFLRSKGAQLPWKHKTVPVRYLAPQEHKVEFILNPYTTAEDTKKSRTTTAAGREE